MRMPRLVWVFAGRTVTLLVLSCRGSYCKSKGKTSNFPDFVSLFLAVCSNVFNNCFTAFLLWWLNAHFNMVLASAYDQKCSLHQLVLKTDVTLVQMLRLIILNCFSWKSFSGDRHLYLDEINWQWKPDMLDLTHAKAIAKFILHSIYWLLSDLKLRAPLYLVVLKVSDFVVNISLPSAKIQASLRIRAVSSESSLFAHMKYGRKRPVWPKIRHLAPLDGYVRDWRMSLRRTKSTIWDGSFSGRLSVYVCMVFVFVCMVCVFVCMVCFFVCMVCVFVCMVCVFVSIVCDFICMVCVFVCMVCVFVCMVCVFVCLLFHWVS